jgi:protease secretion system membrane fusion protein
MTIESSLKKSLHSGWMILIFGFLGFVIWGVFFPLDQGIPANGVVVAEGNRKMIQHQQGGTIEEILVKDGDEVESGQVLVRLNKINLQASYQSFHEQVKGLEQSTPSIEEALREKKNELSLIKVRIQNYEALVNQGFLSKSYLNEYEQKYAAVKGDVALRTSNLIDLQSKLADLKERLKAA